MEELENPWMEIYYRKFFTGSNWKLLQ